MLKGANAYCECPDISLAVQWPELDQKGTDEKGVACYTQAEQRQGRAFSSPSICAYQHTNKGSTWDSSASPAYSL